MAKKYKYAYIHIVTDVNEGIKNVKKGDILSYHLKKEGRWDLLGINKGVDWWCESEYIGRILSNLTNQDRKNAVDKLLKKYNERIMKE